MSLRFQPPYGCPSIFPPSCNCPPGPTGPQGPAGPNWLWENNLFVDSIYGLPLGVAQRNNPALPYLTIADALVDSLPGDNIYVRTGNHTGANLNLSSRNLYLQSATVTNITPGVPLFTGSNFNIFGDGSIVINAGSAFNISGENYIELIRLLATSDETIATITDETTLFIKDEFQSSSPTAAAAFALAGTKHNFTITNFTINGGNGFNLAVPHFDLIIQDIVQVGTGTLFNQTGGFFRLQFESIMSSGNIYQGMAGATGLLSGNDIGTFSTNATPLFFTSSDTTLLMDIKALLGFTATAQFFEIHGQLFLTSTALISGSTSPIFLIEDTAAAVHISAFIALKPSGGPVLEDTSIQATVKYHVFQSLAFTTDTPCYSMSSGGGHLIKGLFEFSTQDSTVPSMSLVGTNLAQCFLEIQNFNNNGPGISLFTSNVQLSGFINNINANSNTACSFNLPQGGTINLHIDEANQNAPSTTPSIILAGGRQNITMNTTRSVLVDGTTTNTEVLLTTQRWENNAGTNNATQLQLIGNSLIEAYVELWNNFQAGDPANNVQMINLNTTNTGNSCVINILRFFSNTTPANSLPLISVVSGSLTLTGGDFVHVGESPVANIAGINNRLEFDFLSQQFQPTTTAFNIDAAQFTLSGQTIRGTNVGSLVILTNLATAVVGYETIDFSTNAANLAVFNITGSTLTTSFTDLVNQNGDGDVFFISGTSNVLINGGNMSNNNGRLFFLTNGNSTVEANYSRGDAPNTVGIELDSTFGGSFSHYINYLGAGTNCILIVAGATPSFMNIAGRYVSSTTNVINNQSGDFGLRADNTILVAGGGAASILTAALTVYSGGVLTTNDPGANPSPPAGVTIIPSTNFANDPAFI